MADMEKLRRTLEDNGFATSYFETAQEAAAYLIRRHPAMDEEDPELFRRAVETAAGLCDEKGIFQDRVFTRVAWLSWKTLKED